MKLRRKDENGEMKKIYLHIDHFINDFASFCEVQKKINKIPSIIEKANKQTDTQKKH